MKTRSIPTIIGAAIIATTAGGFVAVAAYGADNGNTKAAASLSAVPNSERNVNPMVTPAADTTTPLPEGETIAKGSDCFSCHAIDQKIVGPSFVDVAGKFAGQSGAESTLVDAVKKGHVGTWGNVPMPAHPELSDAKIKEIVSWILTLKKPQAAAATTGGKKFTYTVKGKTVSTSFPIFQAGTDKVTPDVFRGYELFNSYCFRCHGADADGGSYAPNLRNSLNNGMSESTFLSIAMTGVKSKGMPSWAGFFTPHQIRAIYEYTDARAVAVVGQGTPKH
ncbi:MAG: c-type cytochrome [Acidiphilium sp.]|nr:c-type cytochrome [Acidiphilium sp.]MDD4936278.1 c-type cytochrome [Acidiphilium sp.]